MIDSADIGCELLNCVIVSASIRKDPLCLGRRRREQYGDWEGAVSGEFGKIASEGMRADRNPTGGEADAVYARRRRLVFSFGTAQGYVAIAVVGVGAGE